MSYQGHVCKNCDALSGDCLPVIMFQFDFVMTFCLLSVSVFVHSLNMFTEDGVLTACEFFKLSSLVSLPY